MAKTPKDEQAQNTTALTSVSAKAGKGEDSPVATVNFAPGETLQELISKFGEGIVFSHARSSVVIALQGYMRSQMKRDNPPDASGMQALVDTWKPGVRVAGKSNLEKAKGTLAKLSPEDRAELLAALQG